MEETPEAGREGDEGEKVVEKLEGVLGFSVSHVGPSLEGVRVGAFVLVLAESGRGVNLETGVFVGKFLRGAVGFAGDSSLKDREHDTRNGYKIPFSCKLQRVGLNSTPRQDVSTCWCHVSVNTPP